LLWGALFFAIYSGVSFVSLFLPSFAGIAQLFPGVVFGLSSRKVTTWAVFAGMAAGISVAVFLILTGRDPYNGVNAGFLALCCNFVFTTVVSFLTRVHVAAF
jgi:solute:Na+ symporter, SSS family